MEKATIAILLHQHNAEEMTYHIPKTQAAWHNVDFEKDPVLAAIGLFSHVGQNDIMQVQNINDRDEKDGRTLLMRTSYDELEAIQHIKSLRSETGPKNVEKSLYKAILYIANNGDVFGVYEGESYKNQDIGVARNFAIS